MDTGIMLKIKEIKAPKSVGVIFGRFNPPHKGHIAAWKMASENDAWYVSTNTSTQGPKDPLPYELKIVTMTTLCPDIVGHVVPSNSWLTLAGEVYAAHGNVVLKLYTDEQWVSKVINQYNGVSGPHGYYNFTSIIAVPTPRLSSATSVREAVDKNDRELFTKVSGYNADIEINQETFFDIVAKYLKRYKK